MPAGYFVISILSRFSRQPSHEYLQTLAKCWLWSLRHAQVQHLHHHFSEFNFTGRVLAERYYLRSAQRALNPRTLPAAERYARRRDLPCPVPHYFRNRRAKTGR